MRESLPCGKCGCGVYDAAAITSSEAETIFNGGAIPRCKSFDRDCVGATDLREYFNQAQFSSWQQHIEKVMK